MTEKLRAAAQAMYEAAIALADAERGRMLRACDLIDGRIDAPLYVRSVARATLAAAQQRAASIALAAEMTSVAARLLDRPQPPPLREEPER